MRNKNMIKICCVYFEGKYQPRYVTNLYRSLKKYYNKPFEFICLSDTTNIEADTVYPLHMHGDIKQHWHKLKFFSPQFADQHPGDEIIVMDIDQIVLGDMTDMIEYPVEDGEMVSYSKWWTVVSPYDPIFNGGWYKFKSGSLQVIWDEFAMNPAKWQLYFYKLNHVHFKYYGEQNFVEKKLKANDKKITLMPGQWVGKHTLDDKKNTLFNKMYMEKFDQDYMILDRPHPDLKIIHFANPDTNIHDCKAEWIKEYWR